MKTLDGKKFSVVDTKKVTADIISEQIQEIKEKCWELHTKLGNEKYPSMWEQFDDMMRLGQLAKTAKKLSDARHSLRYATGTYSNDISEA